MTTSELSTTLYSSPQMRLDWPFSNTPRRPSRFSPSQTSAALAAAVVCASAYLRPGVRASGVSQMSPECSQATPQGLDHDLRPGVSI